jgi:hypothetical protein
MGRDAEDDRERIKRAAGRGRQDFLIKNCNLTIPRPPLRTPKLQEKPSALKREHPALQKMKILSFFLFFGVILSLLDPDPDPQFVCGSGSNSLN